jgi:BirA family biotin operon repressor/biotin-[acetyl-CoA-carboxylase] ligase
MKFYFEQLNNRKLHDLKQAYESALFKRNEPSRFRRSDGKLFSGFIKGVDDSGKLVVCDDNNTPQSYGLKEIELIY